MRSYYEFGRDAFRHEADFSYGSYGNFTVDNHHPLWGNGRPLLRDRGFVFVAVV